MHPTPRSCCACAGSTEYIAAPGVDTPGDSSAARHPWSRLKTAAASLHAAGLGHVFLAIVAIQGASYLAQLFLAGILGPARFGVVRQTEATLALLLVAGSAGMPSLAVSLMGRTPVSARAALLRRLIGIAVVGSLVAAALAAVAALTVGNPLLAGIAWVICLSSASRTWFAYFQGIQQPHRASVVAASISLVSVPIICVLAHWGLAGWMIGRYMGEVLLLGGFVILTRAQSVDASVGEQRTPRALLGLGGPDAVSLLVRAAIDQAPILLLGALGISSLETGYFGFGTLIATGLLLVSAAMGAVLVPRFSARAHDPAALRRLFLLSSAGAFVAVMAVCLMTVAILPLVTEAVLPGYVPGTRIVMILLVCVPLRAVASVAGGLLLSVDRNVFPALTNVCLLGVVVALMVALVPSHGITAAAWSIVATEVVGAIVYFAWAWRHLRAANRSRLSSP